MGKIPKEFFEDDMIYHYTKMETAVNYILPNLQLRLSLRDNMSDPFEAYYPNPFYFGAALKADEHEQTSKTIGKERTFFDNIYQLSFCKSRYKDIGHNDLQNNYESAGFFRLRMWDQYAEKYKGLCIAFSKDNLQGSFRKTFKDHSYYENDVSYLSNSELIQSAKINIADPIKGQKERYLFSKNKDYDDENEFRICLKSNESENLFSIQDAIKGVFYLFNDTQSSNQRKIIHDYLKNRCFEIGIPYIGIFIRPNSISAIIN